MGFNLWGGLILLSTLRGGLTRNLEQNALVAHESGLAKGSRFKVFYSKPYSQSLAPWRIKLSQFYKYKLYYLSQIIPITENDYCFARATVLMGNSSSFCNTSHSLIKLLFFIIITLLLPFKIITTSLRNPKIITIIRKNQTTRSKTSARNI